MPRMHGEWPSECSFFKLSQVLCCVALLCLSKCLSIHVHVHVYIMYMYMYWYIRTLYIVHVHCTHENIHSWWGQTSTAAIPRLLVSSHKREAAKLVWHTTLGFYTCTFVYITIHKMNQNGMYCTCTCTWYMHLIHD